MKHAKKFTPMINLITVLPFEKYKPHVSLRKVHTVDLGKLTRGYRSESATAVIPELKFTETENVHKFDWEILEYNDFSARQIYEDLMGRKDSPVFPSILVQLGIMQRLSGIQKFRKGIPKVFAFPHLLFSKTMVDVNRPQMALYSILPPEDRTPIFYRDLSQPLGNVTVLLLSRKKRKEYT